MQIRKDLQNKLDLILKELNTWFQATESRENKANEQALDKRLLREGQKIADQLDALENLEYRITSLLKKGSAKK